MLMVSGHGQTALPGTSQNGAKVIYTIKAMIIVVSYMTGRMMRTRNNGWDEDVI